MSSNPTRLIIGAMTGTSLDGLDIALTQVTGHGLEMTAQFIDSASRSFDPPLRQALIQLAEGRPTRPLEILTAARSLGHFHAELIADLLRSCNEIDADSIDFVVAHGQTIWHAPNQDQNRGSSDQVSLSWQLFDPWPIVAQLNLPVCYDLRQADLIAGGQGAPITPLADWVLYRHQAQMVLNLGGICNYTCWPTGKNSPNDIQGGDITVCNLMLDGLIQKLVPGQYYDKDGQLAASGTPTATLIQCMNQAIKEASQTNTSLGREQFGCQFIDQLLHELAATKPADILASAVQAIAIRIQQVVELSSPHTVVLAGGGTRNRALVDALSNDADENQRCWRLSDELAIPVEAREAMEFAVLGALSQDGVPITLGQVTGAIRPGVAGTWVYPSRDRIRSISKPNPPKIKQARQAANS